MKTAARGPCKLEIELVQERVNVEVRSAARHKPARNLPIELMPEWSEYSGNKRKKGGCVGDQPAQDKNSCSLNGQWSAVSAG